MLFRVNKWHRLLLSCTILLACGPVRAAADNGELPQFFKGVTSYEAGNYTEARDTFYQLAAAGNGSAAVWYNLGNSYYRLGENGSALWAFKQAAKLDPRWNDLEANMALLQQKVVDELPPLHPSWQRTIFFWHYIFSVREQLVILLVGNFLFWFLLILAKKRPHELTSTAAVLTLIITLAFAASLLKGRFFTTPEGVVKSGVAAVHSAGDNKAQVLFELHECTEVFVEKEQNGWLLISLGDGKRGWVAKENLAY